ncbi:F-box domain-containing protein [Pleurotus pulmonarius]
MQPALSDETVYLILEYVRGKEALWNLLLSSPRLCELVKPFFYAHAAFHPTLANLKCFLRAIEPQPNGRRMALFVRSLIFYDNDDPLEDDQSQLVDKILIKTINLTSLSLTLSSPRPPLQFLQDATFSLTELSIGVPSMDDPLVHFLEAQSQLKILRLYCPSLSKSTASNFRPSSFQNLQILTTTYSVLHQFFELPACVTRLTVDLPYYVRPVGRNSFLNNIRVFCCHSYFNPAVLFKGISFFPNLEWLEIRSMTNIPEVLRTLCTFSTHLHELRGVRFAYQEGTPFLFREANKCFDAIASLEFVEFSGDLGCCHRWLRGSVAPTEVRWESSGGTEWLSDWEKGVVEVDSDEILPDWLL